MSSNQNKKRIFSPDQQRRMTSITRRIPWYMIRGKILRFLFGDLLLGMILTIGWALDQEYTALGAIPNAAGPCRAWRPRRSPDLRFFI